MGRQRKWQILQKRTWWCQAAALADPGRKARWSGSSVSEESAPTGTSFEASSASSHREAQQPSSECFSGLRKTTKLNFFSRRHKTQQTLTFKRDGWHQSDRDSDVSIKNFFDFLVFWWNFLLGVIWLSHGVDVLHRFVDSDSRSSGHSDVSSRRRQLGLRSSGNFRHFEFGKRFCELKKRLREQRKKFYDKYWLVATIENVFILKRLWLMRKTF